MVTCGRHKAPFSWWRICALPNNLVALRLLPLSHRAADSYLVKRGTGKTIVAGYPWFTDWGRDTFISLRGLCLATGRLEEARDILVEWSNVVSEGMLANLFPDHGDRPEYNSVDASLWYIVAVHDFLTHCQRHWQHRLSAAKKNRCRKPSTPFSPATHRVRATAFARIKTACSPPANPACSLPGWTPKSATGLSHRESASRWKYKPCG